MSVQVHLSFEPGFTGRRIKNILFHDRRNISPLGAGSLLPLCAKLNAAKTYEKVNCKIDTSYTLIRKNGLLST